MRRTVAMAVLVSVALLGDAWQLHAADIGDFNTWTLVTDPPHRGMTGSVDSVSQVTLRANGAVPVATDIGYQTVDASNVASSMQGHYFPANQTFHVAVDFDVTAANSMGLAAIGFGIGENSNGTNSAGTALGVINGNPLAFSGTARVGDVTQTPMLFGPAATTSGRFFVRYNSQSGDVTFGVSTTQGAAAPSHTESFVDLKDAWNGDPLLVSFFLRSDAVFFPALSAGSVDVVLANFEVLEGTPIALPEPASNAMLLFGAPLMGALRRRSLDRHRTKQ